MQINPDTNAISVHGREALNLPYKRWATEENGTRVQLDISGSSMFLEVPGAQLRRPLLVDPSDPKGLRMYLERSDVERLPAVDTPYIIVDETDADYPVVELEGTIIRTGYKGAPIDPVVVP